MTQSVTGICNLAISNIGSSVEINDVETENTAEARACRRYYETARDEILRQYPWNFATVCATLALVKEAPTTEWSFAYQVPSDCLRFLRILGVTRNPDRTQRIPYRLVADGKGSQLVYTDMTSAQGEYIQRVTDPTFWAPDFVQALGQLLGFYVAPRLTSGDPYKLRQQCWQAYGVALSAAIANQANEGQPDVVPSDYLAARGDSSFVDFPIR